MNNRLTFSLSLFCLLFLGKFNLAYTQDCRLYIPQPSIVGKQYWEDSRRPASDCETQFAKICYDSILAAFKPFYAMDNSWMRLSEPDTLKQFYALQIPEDLNDNREIMVKDYYKVNAESERTIFIGVPDVSINYRKNDELPVFDKVNSTRMKQRELIGKAVQKLEGTGASTSKELEDLLVQLALTDADFWEDNAFEINTFFNSAASYDSDLKLNFNGKATYRVQSDSSILIHTIKSKNIDPKKMIDGSLAPEDIIDEWYYLLGNWGIPEISTIDDKVSVIAKRQLIDWKGQQPNKLTTHFLVIKIKAGEKLKDKLVSIINWSPLKSLLY